MQLNNALAELAAQIGGEQILTEKLALYASDASEHAGLLATPDAVIRPVTADQVSAVVRWGHERSIALIPRGGGSGLAGGAVAVNGGVVVDLSQMNQVLSFEPELWRLHVQAGVLTGTVQRLARENGLYFPPDPGAAEQSQIGGNVATNAGGPHAFKYGVTGHWVTGIEAVVPPGDLISLGGATRKDVAAYDLMRLLIGSEGTLGIITSVWLRLIPAPEAVLPVVALYPDNASGCAAITRLFTSGAVPAAIEYLDSGTLQACAAAFPKTLPEQGAFMVMTEADGSPGEASAVASELSAALQDDSLLLWAPTDRREISSLWRWRDGVSLAVSARRGGKVSEDIAVPVDRLQHTIEATVEIGRIHGLAACSWGHAGDGNVHTSFLVDPHNQAELERAAAASADVRTLAISLSGTITGEHGVGWLKRGDLSRQLGPRAFELHRQVKGLFDPHGVMNPGKKL
ncbi:MAG: FAD-binding oxidoreductase [Solirubrobacteraceae bacterium]